MGNIASRPDAHRWMSQCDCYATTALAFLRLSTDAQLSWLFNTMGI